jgi:hypothetical protein
VAVSPLLAISPRSRNTGCRATDIHQTVSRLSRTPEYPLYQLCNHATSLGILGELLHSEFLKYAHVLSHD